MNLNGSGKQEVFRNQVLSKVNNFVNDSKLGHTTNGTVKNDSVFRPQMWCGQHLTGQEVSPTKYVYNYSQLDEYHQRTPMCRIAELARYNKIKHEYKLMDESGPAHKKQFTVSLMLTPDQVFVGIGASIKKAQQSAAECALNGTDLPKPPDKILPKKIKNDLQNPTILLGYIAEHLGVEMKFFDEPMPPCPMLPHPMAHLSMRPLIRGAFMPMANDPFFVRSPGAPPFGHPRAPAAPQQVPVIMRPPNTMLPPPPPPVPFFQRSNTQPQSIHKVRLTLGKDFPEFVGKGLTKKRARNSAANQAVSYLGPYLAAVEAKSKNKTTNGTKNVPNLTSVENQSTRTDNLQSDITMTRNGKPKSSISQIHECALHMRMNVEFLVLKEEGPAHDRHYLLRCNLISAERVISADGEGSSKKIAKQNACSLMLTKLQSIESSPIFVAATVLKSHKKTGQPKELKRKTISKDMKMNPEYGHQINPISRLMQVMQARKQSEPKFQLIAERGQSRYKEFVMEVTCDDGLRCEGTGPNKKLAKRAAAEAVLAKIGYVKPMPKPGKSLLKKKPEDQAQRLEIGVFKLDEEGKLEGEANMKEEEVGSAGKVSEVTLSVTASIGSQVMTFSDVDKTVHADEQKGFWNATAAETKSINGKDQENSGKENCDAVQQHAPQPKRRVTFSNEVSACPPPDDSSYPSASITALKSEVIVVNKLRKKGRDSKKWLTEVEKKEIAEIARNFVSQFNNTNHPVNGRNEVESEGFVLLNRHMEHLSLGGNPNELSTSTGCSTSLTAKHILESVAEQYKFSISYTDFPATSNGMENQCFSLISVGIDKPIVCHGSGNTEEAAHEDAACNALMLLCKI